VWLDPIYLMDDQKPKPSRSQDSGPGGPGGLRAPAKGDSAPYDDEDVTISAARVSAYTIE
jgi:hypothetical protein